MNLISLATALLMFGHLSFANDCASQLVLQVANFPKLPLPNQTRWIVSEAFPTDAPITASYVLAFREGKILLGRHRKRGWDILGGHLDPGESPEQATRREVYEEAKAVVGKMIPLGYQEIELFGPKPEGYKYPHPKSYQTFYIGVVDGVEEFEEEEDMVERRWFSLNDARVEADWMKKNPEFFEAAVGLYVLKIRELYANGFLISSPPNIQR